MTSHRQRAQFSRARWRIIILAPAWIAQVLIMVGMVALFSWRLTETLKHYEVEERNGLFPIVEFVWEVANISLSAMSLLFTFWEVYKFIAKTLTPWTMLFTHAVKTVSSLAILALDIVAYIQRKDGHYSLIGLAMDCGLIIVILAPAIYSIRTYKKLAVFDAYYHTVNPKTFDPGDLERDTGYNNHLSVGSFGTLGSLRHMVSSSYYGKPAQQDTTTLEPPRTPSYYHNKRDTKFDQYMVERAMSFDFGFGASPTRSVDRSDSLVGRGVVPRPKALSRDNMGRAPSWGSTQVLYAVPELDERANGHKSRYGEGKPDQEALLGDHARSGSQGSDIPRIEIEDVEETDWGKRSRPWVG